MIKKLRAQKGYTADVHEFTITKRNTALFMAVKQVPADHTAYGGLADGYFDNYSIQEVDLTTGEILFFWNVLLMLPADSMLPASSATSSNNIWDCFHVNSIEEGPNETILISMRNMWAIYLVDKNTGKIIWQLGGKKSDFIFGPNATFSWQHDARFRPGTRISLFDDAYCASSSSSPEGPALGLIFSSISKTLLQMKSELTIMIRRSMFQAKEMSKNSPMGINSLVGGRNRIFLNLEMAVILKRFFIKFVTQYSVS